MCFFCNDLFIILDYLNTIQFYNFCFTRHLDFPRIDVYMCLFYVCWLEMALRKHAYSNILRILPPKNENFQMKKSGSFHISAQNIDCGYLLEPPQSMFLS